MCFDEHGMKKVREFALQHCVARMVRFSGFVENFPFQ